MIKFHTAEHNIPIWVNEKFITAITPRTDETTEIRLLDNSVYTVVGKPSTIATMIEYKESK